jgi:hypothetical protein
MYVTQGDSVQRPLTSGPRGWPAGQIPCPVGRLLSRFRPKLIGHMSTREGKDYGSRESIKARWHGGPIVQSIEVPDRHSSKPCVRSEGIKK